MIGALERGDIPSLVRLYTDPTCRRFLGGTVDEFEAKRRLEQLFEPPPSTRCWAIRSRASDNPLGLIILHPHHDGHDTELSYMLLPEYWGKGYATASLRLAIDQAFNKHGLTRLISETQSANERSVRLLQRIGMTLDRRVMRFGVEQSIYSICADRTDA